MEDAKHKVIVTGFGPFDNHTVNASWRAVEELQYFCNISKHLCDVDLVVEEIPVSYDKVVERVAELWTKHNPVFVLHVGVSSKADRLVIEKKAHSTGYNRPDIYNKCPDETDIEENVIETQLNIFNICNSINDNSANTYCKACISEDAGRYLCEYVFYQSLQIHPMKTLFIHVPDFNIYSTTQSAKGLYYILCQLMQSLRESTKP